MDLHYDLFEELGDGSPIWRGHAVGLTDARRKLDELAKTTRNECFAIHLATKEVVARVNTRSAEPKSPVVLQICYDVEQARDRASVLRSHGYSVVSVIGNEAARAVLGRRHQCDLFIVGCGAPEETRREIVAWLKSHYAGVRIVAVNPPSIPELSGADYNLQINGPETLLPVVATALR